MGKSPGRWIKSVLFGKKHSKSRPSKNVTPGKKVSIGAVTEDQVGYSLDTSVTNELMENGASYARPENGAPAPVSNTTSGPEGLEPQVVAVPLSDDELLKQNQSAAKAQAAFRGYLARRAFRALKGIIRLQALIRGHLVRRQAVATLYHMQAIVKLQTAVRGRKGASEKKLPKYDARDLQVNAREKSVLIFENLASNSYIRKLLCLVPNAVPLTLEYEETEPNSAPAWLERWSHSHFWAPPPPRKASNVKSQRKFGSQIVENSSVKSRRTYRMAVDSVQNGDNGVPASLEVDTKRNLKKGSSHQAELVQEQPQHELERVKRSLRKISASVPTAPEKVDAVFERPQIANEKTETVIEKPQVPKTEEMAIDAAETVNTAVNGVEPDLTDEPVEVPQNDLPSVDADASENGKEPEPEEVDETSIKDTPKVRDGRSLPAKPEFNESPLQNTPPSLPSYMAATESVKAKLRVSGSSPKFVEGASNIRRHSLPTSNGKTASLSPVIQQSNGKATHKTNRSSMSNRDGWKR